MNLRKKGAEEEDLASDFLKREGYKILDRNFRTRFGEIDIVATEEVEGKRVLCFVEVKYRSDKRKGTPFEAVGRKKQYQISRTALYFLMKNHLSETTPVRFDVVGIVGKDAPVLIRSAFDYCPSL